LVQYLSKKFGKPEVTKPELTTALSHSSLL
jgi:hypothetical protein